MHFIRPDKYNDSLEQDFLDRVILSCGKEKFRDGQERLIQTLTPLLNLIHERRFKIYTVGGTNGKGETIQNMAYCLYQQKISYGLFTSPHILSVCERLHFNGKNASYEQLFKWKIDLDSFLGNHAVYSLSFFEYMFALFLWASMEQKISTLLLEVGIGGRLDATNILNANVSVVTNISRDHQDLLGYSYKSILREKLGIARPNRLLVTAFKLEYLQELTRIYTTQNKIDWFDIYLHGKISPLISYGHANRFVALKALGADLELNHSIQISRRFIWSENHSEKIILFTGSHNTGGIRELVQSEWFRLQELEKPGCAIICRFSRTGIDAKVMSQILHKIPCSNADWQEEFEKYYFDPLITKILVTGSYYFVGDVLKYLCQLQNQFTFNTV